MLRPGDCILIIQAKQPDEIRIYPAGITLRSFWSIATLLTLAEVEKLKKVTLHLQTNRCGHRSRQEAFSKVKEQRVVH
jgi:hypothetical protein